MGDPNADSDNPVLKEEQDAQVGKGTRGKLAKGAVLKALCSGFEETTEPVVCLSGDVETNECMDRNGGCWQDKSSNITACKDTFRGRVCECHVVDGVQFKGDGYSFCEDVAFNSLDYASRSIMEVERLVGVPIEKVIGEIGQDKIGPEAPPILNNMVAKKCLFEVKITSYNTPGHDCYTIARLSETQNTPTPSIVEPGKLPEDVPETSNQGATETSKKQRIS
ncbi:hypothetical protein POM88_030572 [Heracleum sosnowskyi]|uniref:Uncharacterized protein n=1 Tax=Heracleum sosnowskyi TaxID=360622 RepID=A0AAD8HVS5_9APIA|nr:hypothetical protein POM88_030572 [Heracleum sosnowskyi]